MAKSKGVISEKEWASGVSATGDAEKATVILKAIESAGRGGMNMVRIGLESGLKWPYSTVKALEKAGTLEVKKVGKANYFRIRHAKKAAKAVK